MSNRNKSRALWLDRYRAALVQACGAAAVLGFTDHAATLCEMIDAARVDKCDGKCYNANNQRGDESDACDWDNPAEVIRINDGANVTDSVTITR